MESTSRLGISDLQHGTPGALGTPAASEPHTILHARTPQAARQIHQLTSSLRDCNRAVGNADALLRDLQDVTSEQDDEIKHLRSQLSRSEERRRKARGSQAVRFEDQPAGGYIDPVVHSTGQASVGTSGLDTLSGLLGQSLRQQDELRREVHHQGQALRNLSQDQRPYQLPISSVPYPVSSYPPIASSTRVDDFRHQDQFNNLSQSVSQINHQLTSQRHQNEAVSSARLHDRMDTLRGDVQRLEHGGGKPATGGMDSHLSTLQHQLQSLEIRQQQALSDIHRSLGDLQNRPAQRDVLLQEISHLRDEVKSNQERSSQIGSSTTAERLAGRLDSLDMSMRQQQESKSVLLQRLDQLQLYITNQDERRGTTLGQVQKLQEQLMEMERAQSRLNLQIDGLRTEMQKQEAVRTIRDEQGTASALRESERHNVDLMTRLQQSVSTAETLRVSNEKLQDELKRLATSQRDADDSQRLKEKAVQLSQKYKARYQAELAQKTSLQKHLDSMSTKLQAMDAQHQSDQARLLQQADSLKTLQVQLSQNAEQFELEKACLQSELATSHARYSTTDEDRSDAQRELDRLQIEYRDAVKHYKTQQSSAASLTEKLSSKLSKLRNREKELQVLVKSSSHREGLMREETERLKKAASELQQHHQQQLASLQVQLRQQRGSVDQRMQEMTQRQQQQLHDLSETISRQKGELSEEKEHVEDLTAKHQLELANRTRLQRQCTQLEQELQICREKIEQQREAYRGKISQLKGKCRTTDGMSIDDLVRQMNASRQLSEQILQDQETILRAVASEVDGLITQVTEQSALPKPILPDTSGLETDARKWISAILGKLTWLQRELRLKEERESLRKTQDS